MDCKDSIKLLIDIIKEEGTATKISVECFENNDVIYSLDKDGIQNALDYTNEVDDIVGIRAFGKDEYDIIGWFGIEPDNEEVLDIIYDYTDNEYCENIMTKLANHI